MVNDIIAFYVPGSNTLHSLRLGHTLINFILSDFSYFAEQCIEAAQKYQRTGENTLEKASVLKEYIRNCHPYCTALINSEFNKIVIDCIIDYLCTSNNVGLEELWVKNLSAADDFGRAIFRRITEYKTGYSINQWKNLLRMQVYSASKAAVIYGGAEGSMQEHRAKKLYFDMAFKLSAEELGSGDLPYVKCSSVPFLPDSPSILKNAANTLEPMVKAMVAGRRINSPVKGRSCTHDQAAGLAVNAIMSIKSPLSSEIEQIIKIYSGLPDEVYEPSSFKAIIDLEFDKLLERGLYLRPQGSSYIPARYSDGKASFEDEPSTHIDYPDPSTAAIKLPMADKLPESERIKKIIHMTEDPARKYSGKRTMQEINSRCSLIWSAMQVRTGWNMTVMERNEWFKQLTQIRFGIGTGELSPYVLDKFLDATEEVYGVIPGAGSD